MTDAEGTKSEMAPEQGEYVPPHLRDVVLGMKGQSGLLRGRLHGRYFLEIGISQQLRTQCIQPTVHSSGSSISRMPRMKNSTANLWDTRIS